MTHSQHLLLAFCYLNESINRCVTVYYGWHPLGGGYHKTEAKKAKKTHKNTHSTSLQESGGSVAKSFSRDVKVCCNSRATFHVRVATQTL